MLRLRPDHQRLTGHSGAQPDDLGSLFALVGPTDLALFSSPVNGDLPVLEWRVAEDRVYLFRIGSMLVNFYG